VSNDDDEFCVAGFAYVQWYVVGTASAFNLILFTVLFIDP
jgi:hypothetical protein